MRTRPDHYRRLRCANCRAGTYFSTPTRAHIRVRASANFGAGSRRDCRARADFGTHSYSQAGCCPDQF